MRADGLPAGGLIRAAKVVFTEFALPKKKKNRRYIDAGMNFVSDRFQQFYKPPNID